MSNVKLAESNIILHVLMYFLLKQEVGVEHIEAYPFFFFLNNQ